MRKDKLIPVEGHPGLFRDPATNAIINMNKSGARLAREARAKRKHQEEEIEGLKDEVKELKDLISKLLEKMEE